jgi:hypothetical protein
MYQYLRTLYLRTDRHAIWHSNLAAGFIARPGVGVGEIVAEICPRWRPDDLGHGPADQSSERPRAVERCPVTSGHGCGGARPSGDDV